MVVGALTAMFTVWSHLTDPTAELVSVLVRSLLPFCLSAILVGVGWWMRREAFNRVVGRRIVLWLFVGGTFMAGFELATILFQQAEGVVLTNRVETVHNGFVRGALIGAGFGLYDGQRRVSQSQERQLRRQNDRLDQFAATVSHNLRNPLNVANGYLNLLETDLKDNIGSHEWADSSIEEIQTAHARMDDIIQDAITIAREGTAVIAPEPVALETAVEAAWRSIVAPDATVRVQTAGTVAADHDRLVRLLENALRNAVEHGGEDVTIQIGMLATERGFYVEDDGVGIDPKIRTDVFDQGETTAPDGSGLGLAIVRTIAGAHGWSIRVVEGTAGGARFEFLTDAAEKETVIQPERIYSPAESYRT